VPYQVFEEGIGAGKMRRRYELTTVSLAFLILGLILKHLKYVLDTINYAQEKMNQDRALYGRTGLEDSKEELKGKCSRKTN